MSDKAPSQNAKFLPTLSLTLSEKMAAMIAVLAMGLFAIGWLAWEGDREMQKAQAASLAASEAETAAQHIVADVNEVQLALAEFLRTSSSTDAKRLNQSFEDLREDFAEVDISDPATRDRVVETLDAIETAFLKIIELQGDLGMAGTFDVAAGGQGMVESDDPLIVRLSDAGHALDQRLLEEVEFEETLVAALAAQAAEAWRRAIAQAVAQPLKQNWEVVDLARARFEAAISTEGFDEDSASEVRALAESLDQTATAMKDARQSLEQEIAAVSELKAELTDLTEGLASEMRDAGVAAQAALQRADVQRRVDLWTGLVVVGVATALLNLIIAINIVRPLRRLTGLTNRIAGGENIEPPVVRSARSEIGALTQAVAEFAKGAAERRALRAKQNEREATEKRALEEETRRAEEFTAALRAALTRAAEGDLDARVTPVEGIELSAAVSDACNGLLETIDRMLSAAEHTLDGFAEGDLTSTMEANGSGRMAALSAAVNGTGERLSETVAVLKSASGALRESVAAIRAGADRLGDRSARDADLIERAVGRITELASGVETTAEQTVDVRRATSQARDASRNGDEIVEKLSSAMEDILASSAKTVEIVSMIDRIASETNMLALNASVEAARAGRAGAGFAVVAEEVRAMAGSAASAAQEIGRLSEEVSDRIRLGVSLSEEATQVLGAISASVSEAAGQTESIAADCESQASGLDEMRALCSQLLDASSENRASVEQTCQDLGHCEIALSRLDQTVAGFRLAQQQESAALSDAA